MLRPLAKAGPAAWLLVAVWALGSTARVLSDESPAQALERARALLEDKNARAAVALLEDVLPAADDTTRRPILDLLRRAYGPAADQAESDGQAHQAAAYRENLAILEHRPTSAPQPPSEKPGAEEPRPKVEAPEPLPAPGEGAVDRGEVADSPSIESTPEVEPTRNPDPETKAEPPAKDESATKGPETPRSSQAPETKPVPDGPAAIQAQADTAFRRKQYREAGTLYAQLAQAGKLPRDRHDAWAYCRRFEVVRRINAQPRSANEWTALAGEIERIRELSPRNWYDEYLRSLVAERLDLARRAEASKVVLRGAAPEERGARPAGSSVQPVPPASAREAAPARSDGPGAMTVPTSPPMPENPRRPDVPTVSTAPRPPAVEVAPAAPNLAGPDLSGWRVLTTTNFRIYHADPELARRVGQVAEAAREEQSRRWTGQPPRGVWDPLCEIYLYPDARIYSQRTGQPEDSPGFSTSGLTAGRVTARRINLRADHPKLIEAVLPHEVTHIVLAEIFPDRQIPRWADEGMAVLAEPVGEQSSRAEDLVAPLNGGRVFSVEQLMLMDSPEEKYWPLYYAQSISLTRFLVEQSSPSRFIEFIRDSQRHGAEAALRRHYQMDGFADLQDRWLAHAKAAASAQDPEVRTASDDQPESETTRR